MCYTLVDWWNNRPPVAVFVVTLAACALTLASIATYVNVHKNNLPDPNVKNWNDFFTTLSQVDVCIPDDIREDSEDNEDNTDHLPVGGNYSALVKMSFTASDGSFLTAKHLNNKRLRLEVPQEAIRNRVHIGRRSQSLVMSIGLPASGSKLPSSPEDSDADERDSDDDAISNVFVACLTFSGPVGLLPNAIVLPMPCQQQVASVSNVNISLPCSGEDTTAYRLQLGTQPHLTQLLTQEETVLIELHLLYTTCALVLLVSLVLGYAVCRRLLLHRRSSITTGLLSSDWSDKHNTGDV